MCACCHHVAIICCVGLIHLTINGTTIVEYIGRKSLYMCMIWCYNQHYMTVILYNDYKDMQIWKQTFDMQSNVGYAYSSITIT